MLKWSVVTVSLLLLIVFLLPSSTLHAVDLAVAMEKPVAVNTHEIGSQPPQIEKPTIDKPSQKPQMLLPAGSLLQVKDAYLHPKERTLMVVVQNEGPGRLSDRDYLTGQLVVFSPVSAIRWHWPLIKVNPSKDHFRNSTTFNTGKKIPTTTQLTIMIEGVGSGKPWRGTLPRNVADKNNPAGIKAVAPVGESNPPGQAPTPRPIRKPQNSTAGVSPAPVVKQEIRAFNPDVAKKAGIRTPINMEAAAKLPVIHVPAIEGIVANKMDNGIQHEKKTALVITSSGESREETSLPIEILSPRAGELHQWGGWIRIRYRITKPTGRGLVTFAFRRTEEPEVVHQGSHQYEPPEPAEADAEERTAVSGEETPEARPRPEEEDTFGVIRVFNWFLPRGENYPTGSDYVITAVKGRLTGRSETFTMLAPCEGGERRRVSADTYRPLRTAGERVRVLYRLCGCTPFAGRVGDTDLPVFVLPMERGHGEPLSERLIPAEAVLEARDEGGLSGALQVTLPEGLAAGGYAIGVVTPEDGIFITREFDIRRPTRDGPLEISAPAAGAVYHRNEWIDVVVEPTGYPLNSSIEWGLVCYDPRLYYGADEDDRLAMGQATHHDGRFRFQVPNTFPNCEEVRVSVSATVLEPDCPPRCRQLTGQSAVFRTEVFAQNDGYVVTSPRWGDTFRMGGSILVRVTHESVRVPDGPLDVWLLQTLYGRLHSHYQVAGGTFLLPVPEDLSVDDASAQVFQLIVSGPPGGEDRLAWSDCFRIVP